MQKKKTNEPNDGRVMFVAVLLTALVLFSCILTGCSVLPVADPGQGNSVSVRQAHERLAVGMSYQQVLEVLGGQPSQMEKDAAMFVLEDGELWAKFSSSETEVRHLVFWGTVQKLPDGSTEKRTSREQALASLLDNPILIDVEIDSKIGSSNREGNCYYEQYGPGNILIEASERGNKEQNVSMLLVNGKYLLKKGSVPQGAEHKYLAGYLANLHLMQTLIAKGMRESTPLENGTRNFSIEEKVSSLEISTMLRKLVYPAPWAASGYVKPIESDDNGFSFDIRFDVEWKADGASEKQTTRFSGFFKKGNKRFGEDVLMGEWEQFRMLPSGGMESIRPPIMAFEDLR
ncbi:MAG: hypothetical protein JW808_04215 [Victivallales bacterium]|nr:hypothetical protein [Victivallales bacterium]